MKPIKSANGKVLGYEHTVSDYCKQIRSRNNALRGYFNPKEGPEGKTFLELPRITVDRYQRSSQSALVGGTVYFSLSHLAGYAYPFDAG